MATNVRDPRSIITPDAFEISKALLGTPLGRPSRRLWALLIDLVVIGILTAVTASISLILWGAVAIFFITMAFRKPGKSFGQVTSILFRGATGCLGVVILFGVLIGYLAVATGDGLVEDFAAGVVDSALDDVDDVDDVAAPGGGPPGVAGANNLRSIFRGISAFASLSTTQDPDEAREILAESLRQLGADDLTEDEARQLLDEVLPDDVPWAEDRDSVYAGAFRDAGIDTAEAADEALAEVAEAPEPTDADVGPTPAERVADLSDDEAVERWASLRATLQAAEDPDPADEETFDLLSRRLVPLVADDTLDALEERLDDVSDDLETSETRLAEARAEIESGEAGFLGLFRDIWDQAGSAIGLWSIYFTVALTLTNGRTIGKKAMGLRVLRLDGERLNWWASFERAGGYVAGIATGTLGFLQVFWDANRQCVHDKIVGTVVVMDGAEIEPGAWQEAWAAQQNDAGPRSPTRP